MTVIQIACNLEYHIVRNGSTVQKQGLNDDEITVFDSPGIAIQDRMAAGAIFESAQEMKQVQYIDF